jgi:hypothetical protein
MVSIRLANRESEEEYAKFGPDKVHLPFYLLEAIVDEFKHDYFEVVTDGGNTICVKRVRGKGSHHHIEFWFNPREKD